MNIQYSEIFSKAWQITWKHKILWFFGFLAMLGGRAGWNSFGNGGGGNPDARAQYNLSETDWRYFPPEWKSGIEQLERIDINTWISIAVITICCLLLLALTVWLGSIIGRGGLISGIVTADTTGKATFRETWNAGTRYFLRLFLVRLLAVAAGLALVLFVVFLGILTCGIGLLPLICVMFPIGIGVNLWFAFMDYAIVVENLGIGEAVGRAWTVLRDHIGPVLVFWIILFAVSLLVGLGLLILFAPSAVLIFLSFLALLTGTGVINATMLTIGIVVLVLSILVSIVVNSIYTVWETGVMTLAYREFAKATPSLTVVGGSQPQPIG
jgi:hypothetical protein